MKKTLLLLGLTLVFLIPASVYAQTGSDFSIELTSLQNKLAEIQGASSTDSDRRAKLVEYYTQSIANLEAAKEDRLQARAFAEAVTASPANLAKIQLELNEAGPSFEKLPENLEELEQELLSKNTELLRLNSQLSENRSAIAAEQELDLSVLLAQALQQFTASQNKLSLPLSEKSADLGEAQRALRTSELAAKGARVEQLQQRSLSRDARLSEWRARQRLLTKKANATTQRITELQNAVNNLRQNQANQLAQKTQIRASAPETDTGIARELADENAALARRMADVTNLTENLLEQLARLRAERTRVDRYFDSVSQQLAVSGADRLSDLGIELLEQKRKLSQLDTLPLKLEENNRVLARAQLELLRLEDQQVELPLTSSDSDEDVVTQLLNEQRQLLQGATTTLRRYIEALTTTRTEGQDLQLRTEQYSDLLESRLFWIPSTPPVGWSVLKELGAELKWLFAPQQWNQVADALADTGSRNFIPALIIIALAMMLVRFRKRLKRKLALQAVNIGKVQSDQASSTWIALLISLLLALPGPLALLSMYALVMDGEGFALHLAIGIWKAALLWFLLGSFWWICCNDGLAEKHFRWSAKSLASIRQSLPWVMRFLVPVALLTPVVSGASDGVSQDSLSRILFTIASLAMAYFPLRILRPNSAVVNELQAHQSGWTKPVRYILFPIAVLLPLVLLVLSWMGYQFTALELEGRLFQSVVLVVCASLFYQLITRAISVIERRMALERLVTKRRAEREASSTRKAADDAAEGMPDVLDLQESDLQTINSQTKAFLKMLVLVLAGIWLWNLWSDVLPALGVFDEIVLWHISSGDVNLPDKVVTLADFIVAGLILFITYYGARNIPGSLEIAVLRRFKLEPGTSYAITTIVKYIIVFTGVMVTLNLIGAQWSKLQWLIAALGVGLGFGLQEIVANFVSGILILFERPVRVGDFVTVGEHTGTVNRIRMRATTLTDWDRKEQIVPNKTFITESLTNWTLSDPITRVIIKVGVAYGSNIELVHKILNDSIAANKRVVGDPSPQVFFVGFGESSLDFEIRVFIQSMLDMMPLKHELHIRIEKGLREADIVIPFPQRDLWIRTETQALSAEDLAPKQ